MFLEFIKLSALIFRVCTNSNSNIFIRRKRLEEVRKFENLPPHPYIVKFYKAWEERGLLFIQTELCRENLANHCKDDAVEEKVLLKYLVDLLIVRFDIR